MRRFLLPIILFLSLLATSCDRGATPELIGKTAPDFRVTDEDRSVALSDLRGKTVLLNFWASWCPPCVEETPSMVAMQEKLKGRVVIFAVSTDADRAAYQRFLREEHTNFLTVRDAAQQSNRLYGTSAFPETYVIDSAGIVRRKFIGPVEWTNPEIMKYLASL